MFKMFLTAAADATATAEETAEVTGFAAFLTNYGSIIMLVALIAVFYFFIIRPQKKQEKETNAMRNAIEVGDEVTTIGGIIGEVVSIKEETVTIVTSKDNTKIRFLKSAISRVDVKAADKK